MLAVDLTKAARQVCNVSQCKDSCVEGSMRVAVDKWGSIQVTHPGKGVVKEEVLLDDDNVTGRVSCDLMWACIHYHCPFVLIFLDELEKLTTEANISFP